MRTTIVLTLLLLVFSRVVHAGQKSFFCVNQFRALGYNVAFKYVDCKTKCEDQLVCSASDLIENGWRITASIPKSITLPHYESVRELWDPVCECVGAEYIVEGAGYDPKTGNTVREERENQERYRVQSQPGYPFSQMTDEDRKKIGLPSKKEERENEKRWR